MKRLISTLLLVAFTTAVSPVNAFGPTPGQLEYQNYGYSQPYNQYGSFSPTPQQNQYNDYNSYDYNQNGGSYGSFSSTPQQNQYSGYNSYNQNTSGGFSNTPQQGWGNTNPDGIFYVPQEYCSHWQNSRHEVASWCEEYNESKHIKYKEYEVVCYNCNQVIDSYTQQDYEEHRFTSYNQCSKCGYTAECNHGSTSLKTYTDYFEPIDGYNHTEVYVEKTVCSYCGEVLYSQPRTRNSAHYFQYGRCWTCGYVQQTISQPQYTPPVVNQPEYVEEPVYVEQPHQSTTVLPYQQALEEGRAYAVTPNGLHINKRNYAPGTVLGYADEYYCSINSIYAPLYLPADEVYEQKGDYLYRVSTGERVSAKPSILRICDARISELKTTLKGLYDASSRVEQYKQVKKGQIPLTSIVEQNRSYIAKSNQSHSKVSEVQVKLQQLGYTSQKDVTGKIDTKTLNNIAYFQSQNGILSTGWLDNETYNAIMSYSSANSVDTSPYAEITGLYLDNKELVVSVQGNQYTSTIIIIVKGLGGETFYNASSATKRFTVKESGIYEVEVFAKNINNEIYTLQKQEIYIDLPKSLLEIVMENVPKKYKVYAGIETSVFSNLVLEPVLDLTVLLEKIMYGYSDSEDSKEEIIDLCRNGIAQYINDPIYYYAGQKFGDVFSVGAEIYFGGKAIKGIIKGGTLLKNGFYLYNVDLVTDVPALAQSAKEAVMVVISGAEAMASTGVVVAVSNRVLGTLDNFQNAINGGNSSSSNNGINKIKTNLGNEIDINPSNNHSSVKGNPGYNSTPNSSVDIMDSDGNLITRRWYNSNGKAVRDVDFTNHGNPKNHPEWPHEHFWSYDLNGNPTRY